MTRTHTKLFIAAAFALAAAGGGLYATPVFFSSPQKQATATEFWSDADLFLSPRGYAGIEFDKFFSFISFQNEKLGFLGDTSMLQLGFATKFSGLYAALYYGGNTLALQQQNYTEDNDGKRVYASDPPLKRTAAGGVSKVPHNEGAIVIGVADMGFRLAFASEYNSVKLKDFFIGTGAAPAHYNSYQDEYGSLNPQIAWGMAKDLTPIGLKPHVYIDLDFFRDYKKTSEEGVGEIVYRSNNEFTLDFTAAAGSISLVKVNGFDFGVDLWYNLKLNLFDNEYTPSPGKFVSYKAVKVAAANPADDYYKTSYMENWITPYLYAAWSGDRLELSGELELAFGIKGEKGSQFIEGADAMIKDGTSFEANTFSFVPALYLGMQYAIVREKLFLNVGSTIEILSLDLTSTDTDLYSADAKVGDTVKSHERVFEGANTNLTLGLTFNITKNVGLQAMCGVNNLNQLSLFETGINGMAFFSQIMATLKF